MYGIKAKFLEEIYAGDIVYLRRDGVVVAAKIERYEITLSMGLTQTIVCLYRADGIKEKVYLDDTTLFYATVEGAIHNERIDIDFAKINSIYEDLEFVACTDSRGASRYAKRMYEWDGYNAVKKRVCAECFKLTMYPDCVWIAEFKNANDAQRFYETREDCLMEHQTKVITF